MIPVWLWALLHAGTIRAWDPSLLLTGLLLAGTLLLGAVIIAAAGRWRRRAEPETLGPNEQLAQFRLLYEQGAMSQEEFDRVRALLGQQLRHDLNVPLAEASKETGIRAAPGQGSSPPANGPVSSPPPPQDGIRPA
jgi:hypothetical protein